MGKPPLASTTTIQNLGSARDKPNENSLTAEISANQQVFMEAEQLKVQLKKQQSATNNAFAFNKLMNGGSSSAKNAVFERKGNENYKSSSRVAHHHGIRGQSSGLSQTNYGGGGGASGTPKQANLQGIVASHGASSAPRTGTSSSNRNAAIFGLKSDTTLDFGMPTTTTTASSDTNMLFNRNPSSHQQQHQNYKGQGQTRALSNAPAPPSAGNPDRI